MGTQEGERDWVDVANDLFSKCHINLRLRRLTDCDANVFITLYENILGEKVPDYIAEPCSQEEDVHNIQSVIDSLSLDYLQISLSHITGENVVRGDKESIKNLLEIFDGLLEYLNEEIREESQNGEELSNSLNEDVPCETKESTSYNATEHKETKLEGASSSSTGESAAQSSKHSLHSWNAEEMGSTSELIGLGVSARTFTGKEGLSAAPQTSDAMTTAGPLDAQGVPLTEPLHSAIALQPPNQSNTPHRPDADPHTATQPAKAAELSHGHMEEEAAPATTEIPKPVVETVVSNGLQSPFAQFPAVSETSLTSQQRARTEAEGETLEPTNGGPRRVLFRTQPDVLFLTLQDEMVPTTPSPPDTEEEEQEEEEDLSYTRRLQGRRIRQRERMDLSSNRLEEDFEDPLSYRRQRNRKAEEELHHISENLSHRLEELDEMLKRVLGESGESSEVREEDKQSHHSDSVMECRKTPRQHTGIPDVESTHRTRSLSPSPPRVRRSLKGQLENAMAEALSLNDGRQTNLTASDHSRRGDRSHRLPQRKHSKYLENKDYEEELKRYEDKERTDLNKARLKAQEAEREYREAILRDASQAPRLSPARTKAQHKSQHKTQTTPGRRRREAPRKAPSLKVKENELLPVLLEELPHLHISPHALGRMWEQQMQQVDRLHALSTSNNHQRRSKLSSQVEEAQRKHDLLVEIVRKEQDHNRRLRDFKERIQQQKSTQNRVREQRQQIARAKKYYNDYHVQHRARLMRARTKEERMFRQLFEEGLELQKVRLREQRASAREQRLEHQRRHQDQIKSMENYYKDQFSLLAEKLAQERQEIQVRKKAQEKALLKMKRELRSRMEREIGELQKIIIQNDEDDYFQDLEVQRLRNRVQMAAFQYNTSYLH
ncbi:centrosomal protein of 95 kDa-like isoform X3 [Toxotes jaculatrix]|uniref:centrosomal protein of 95 kDa-like isoform X3 n=1 Tax=Toxotes jaculatrix TaxID=941984 RepID=UPI001B3ADFA5|nr:centrosomal protein of 95 kDa-like isoform X3 [Toxotes jaculatrix]